MFFACDTSDSNGVRKIFNVNERTQENKTLEQPTQVKLVGDEYKYTASLQQQHLLEDVDAEATAASSLAPAEGELTDRLIQLHQEEKRQKILM